MTRSPRRSRIMREAADLLACLASNDDWCWTTHDLPGDWTPASRVMAARWWQASYDSGDYLHWAEWCAEAEAALRARLQRRTRRHK